MFTINIYTFICVLIIMVLIYSLFLYGVWSLLVISYNRLDLWVEYQRLSLLWILFSAFPTMLSVALQQSHMTWFISISHFKIPSCDSLYSPFCHCSSHSVVTLYQRILCFYWDHIYFFQSQITLNSDSMETLCIVVRYFYQARPRHTY